MKSYDPLKNRLSNLLVSESVIGQAKELKIKIEELKQRGIVISQIETKPHNYEYTFWYHKDKTVEQDLTKEEWRDVDEPELAGRYQISNLGRIRSIRVICENFDKTVLTDGGGKRHFKKIKDIYRQVFGKELSIKRPVHYIKNKDRQKLKA